MRLTPRLNKWVRVAGYYSYPHIEDHIRTHLTNNGLYTGRVLEFDVGLKLWLRDTKL